MAAPTIAARIAELEADRTALRASISAARAAGNVKSFGLGPMSQTRAEMRELREDLAQVDRDLQRLYRGGRGLVVDMSYSTEPGVTA